MKLYWGRMSPYARKVMVVAHETGTASQIELIEVRVDMASINMEVQAANPLGKIPTLVLENGAPLYDSRTICEYLNSQASQHDLFPDGPGRWEVLRFHALGDGIMDALILWRQEQLKPSERSTPEWMTAFATKVTAALDHLDQDTEHFFAQPFNVGHAAIGCALGYLDLRFADLNWRTGRPRLERWHATFEARPSAIATRPNS